MSIKARLQLNALFGLILVLVIGISLLLSAQKVSHANQKVVQANDIVTDMSQMRYVTFDYLLNQTDRSSQQWHEKNQEINSSIANFKYLSAGEQSIWNELRAQHHSMENTFATIVADYQNPPNEATLQALHASRDKLLVEQLLLKQQIEVSDASKLSSLGQSQIQQAITDSSVVIVLSIALLFAATTTNIIFINFTINRGLAKLKDGASKIAHGNLGLRLKVDTSDEFGQLSKSLNAMASNLEAIEKIKSEFILLTSHQLRMPLTAIGWISEELLNSSAKFSAAKRKDYLRQIHESNRRMVRLVGDLLNVSKIDFGSLTQQLQTVDLTVPFNAALQDLDSDLVRKHLKLKVDVDPNLQSIQMDPEWIRAIFQNLLSNAIKYSRDNQLIQITISQDRSHTLIKVEDHGIGITKSQKKLVFTKLFRAENAKVNVSEGTGLGLYITKSMVELAGGHIWFTSEENKGSTFYVKLKNSQQIPR